MDVIEMLKALHYKCREYLDIQDFDNFIPFVEHYIKRGDVNELKTLMVITKAFKGHPKFGPVRERMVRVFEKNLKNLSK